MHTRHIVVSVALTAALTFGMAAHALSTLRVGSHVLTAGDSEVRVTELLGKPSHKSHSRRSRHTTSRSRSRSRKVVVLRKDANAEKWQYRRGDHVTTVTIVDGKVSDIEDHRI